MANQNGTMVLIHGLWMDHPKSKAVTDYKEYPERAHYTLGQAGWEQVADDLLFWAASQARDESLATAF